MTVASPNGQRLSSRASRVVLQDVAVFYADSTVPDTIVRAIARIRSANFFRTARVKGALTSHAAGFLGTDVVQCLIHVGDDVKAVEDMQRLGAVFADQLQIGFPHVGTDEYDFGNYVLAHSGEESLEGFDGSLFAYPKKAGNSQINLVDQGKGAGKWQREQTAVEPLRGRTATSMLFLSAPKWAWW